LIGCDAPSTFDITQKDEPLALLDDPTQVAQFELLEADTGRLIADGFSLRSIAQAPAPFVNDEQVQATDVLFSGDTLLVSYNFKGEPHRGALQIIDVSTPETPTLRYELQMADADLNRIRMYQDRYLVVAAGTIETAASLQIFDLQDQPELVASLDLPSRQATMVTLYRDYAIVTTGDDGGVIGVHLDDPTAPELVFSYPLSDARYVDVLSDREVLLVNGGAQAALTRISWSELTGGVLDFTQDAPNSFNTPNSMESSTQSVDLSGLSVGAPSWGFRAGDRFHLSADEQGLLTFSLSTGGLVETGVVPTQGDANAGAVDPEGRFALLANGQEGLLMLDIQEGQPTQVLASFDTPGDHGSANAIAIQGDLVALADGLGGVKLLEAHLLRDDDEVPNRPACEGLVYEGTFTPQVPADLSQFCADGYSVISEDLIVRQTGMTSLAGLECLCEVQRDAKINSNSTLLNLTGLNNLRVVGRSLIVSHNRSLRNFDALSSLQWIGEDLSVHNESSLANMNGLSSLEAIGRHVTIQSNLTLRSMGNLGSLTWLGQDFLIKNNSSLASLSGYNELTRITGLFEITGNRSLRGIEGLTQLEVIEGNAHMNSNSSLQSINGFDALRDIMGNLSVNNNNSLRTLTGLLGITVVDGDLSVRNNSSLPSARAEELRNQIGAGLTGTANISGNSW
jgi:hypothetical protein